VTEDLVTSILASAERRETVWSLTEVTTPNDAAGRDDLVARLEVGNQFGLLFGALLLRTDQNEINTTTSRIIGAKDIQTGCCGWPVCGALAWANILVQVN